MRVLLINGSPHEDGNTYRALKAVENRLIEKGAETQIIWIGNKPVQGCIACNSCVKKGHCAFGDPLYHKVYEQLQTADALVVGSPTYYGGPAGSLCALLDRVFYSCRQLLQNKVWASVIVCRRGGATAAFQRLNMYADMTNMVHATSQYWNIVYGWKKGEVEGDAEGMQTMRTLADNIAWLVACTRSRVGDLPPREKWQMCNFIREDRLPHC